MLSARRIKRRKREREREITFIGTSSPVMNANDCCPEAARPIRAVPPINMPTFLATAQMMQPRRDRAAEPMKKY